MDNIESGIQTFYFEHNRIQMMAIGSDPYFSLEDVCEILKIKDTKRAKTRLDEQGVCDAMTLTSSGFQKKDFISETNLYRLIFKSHRLENIKFAVWMTSEVLPAIVNKGDYMTSGMIERLIKYLEELWERSNWNDWQRNSNIQFWKQRN